MLHDAVLDNRFWSMAINHAVYTRNRPPYSASKKKGGLISPYQALRKVTPKLDMLEVYSVVTVIESMQSTEKASLHQELQVCWGSNQQESLEDLRPKREKGLCITSLQFI
jgi:hypothetical protein